MDRPTRSSIDKSTAVDSAIGEVFLTLRRQRDESNAGKKTRKVYEETGGCQTVMEESAAEKG